MPVAPLVSTLPVPTNAMGQGKAPRTFGVYRKTVRVGESTLIWVNAMGGRDAIGTDAGTQMYNVELWNSAGVNIPLVWPNKVNLCAPWGTGIVALGSVGFCCEPQTIMFDGVASSWCYQQQNMLKIPDGTWNVWVEKNAAGTGVQWAYGAAWPTTPYQPMFIVTMLDGKLTAQTPQAIIQGQNVFPQNPNTPNLDGYGWGYACMEFRWTDQSGNTLPAGQYTFKYRNPDGTLDPREIPCALSVGPSGVPITRWLPKPIPGQVSDDFINAISATVGANPAGGIVYGEGDYVIARSLTPRDNVLFVGLRPGTFNLIKQYNAGDYANCFFNTSIHATHFGFCNVGFYSADGHPTNVFTAFGGPTPNNDNAVMDHCVFGDGVTAYMTSDGGIWNECTLSPLAFLNFGRGAWIRGLYHQGRGNINSNVERDAGDSNILEDCWWNGGMQGPLVGQGWSGDVTHNLRIRCRFTNIDVAGNRSECDMQEGGSFSNNLVIKERWENCPICFQTWGAQTVGNTWINPRIDGPSNVGFNFVPQVGSKQGTDVMVAMGNVIQDGEWFAGDQAVNFCGGASANNRIIRPAVVDRQPSMNHEYAVNTAEYVNQNPAFLTTGINDTIEDGVFVNVGTRPIQSGFTVIATPVNVTE